MLARATGGNVTIFAFDAGEELSEHTAPFDALVIVLEGAFVLTIGGQEVRAAPDNDRAHACQRAARRPRGRTVAPAAHHAAGAEAGLTP